MLSCLPVRDDIAEPPMLGHHIYRVHPDGDEWTVTKEGEDGSRARFGDRDRAIGEAMRLAQTDQPAKVRIDNDDGSIAEERVIGLDSSDALQP
jgi:Uncharacterized protein conserved in bacteria (DUF2188)